MSLSNREVDNIFQSIVIQVDDPPKSLETSMAQFKPEDPTRMEWRFELRGFVRGLTVTGKLDDAVLGQTWWLFNHQPRESGERPGRDLMFSVDVHASEHSDSGCVFHFEVAAMNSMDAYVQLSKRLVYRTIPDVFHVDVFEGLFKDRYEGQETVRVFRKDELIFVNDDQTYD